MILTGKKIIEEVGAGRIRVSPFDEASVGPNSLDLRLSPHLRTLVVPPEGLDFRKPPEVVDHVIGGDGFVLQPGLLYLGSTVEAVATDDWVPLLTGRSTVGRMGVTAELSAGLGEIAFAGTWTLEITAVHPVRVYAGMRFCQVYFAAPLGDTDMRYAGKYQGQYLPTPGRGWMDREWADARIALMPAGPRPPATDAAARADGYTADGDWS